jgi:dolichol-phosphate mannosyltransferase
MRDIVVIPTYNERDTIGGMIELVHALYPSLEIWVVDDNSPDGTGGVVREYSKKISTLRLVLRQQKNGLGSAYKDVLGRIQKEVDVHAVVTMDADGSHDPLYIKDLLSALDHSDVAIGSRYVRGGKIVGWGWVRNLISRGGNTYVRLLTRSPIHDLTSGFVAIRFDVLRAITMTDIPSSGYSYQMEFKHKLLRNGFSFTEVPITFVDRRVGQSKMSGKIILEGMLTPWRMLFGRAT